MTDEIYDVIIIGAGMAGLSAAVYTARAGLKTLIFGDIKKSMLAEGEKVGNYIGFIEVPGSKILKTGLKQVIHYGAEHINNEVVHAIQTEEKMDNKPIYKVKTDDTKEYKTKSLVIATGTTYKKSGAKGEDEFKRKGVHYCASCDGFFYKEKKVAIIGNGNLAAEEAIEFTSLTKNITLISQKMNFEISKEMRKELKKHKIKMVKGKVKEIKGTERVESVLMENGKEIKVSAVFIAMGTATGLDFSNKLGIIMDEGVLHVDKDGKTNLDGVYAAGSSIGGNVQAAKSVGDGCNSGIAIIKYLKGLSSYVDQT